MQAITSSNKNFSGRPASFLWSALACLLIALALIHPSSGQQRPAYAEDQLKAAYIFNFVKFASWPESNFATPESPVVIGILGQDRFGPLIDELVKGELIKGHPIRIERFETPQDVKPCHVLYVDRSLDDDLDELFVALRGKDVLTISDINDFTAEGGMIKLFLDDSKMKFQVNANAVKATKIVLSSRLLRLADVCCED